MKKQLGDRLPKITAEERALIKGSNDFYGMVRTNHLTLNPATSQLPRQNMNN